MCRRIECPKCGRPSWAGCGAHVEQVLGNVPKDERCQCNETKSKGRPPETPAQPRSWLRGLFGGN